MSTCKEDFTHAQPVQHVSVRNRSWFVAVNFCCEIAHRTAVFTSGK